MREYGFVKLDVDSDITIPCTWNLNIFNRMVDSATNTVCDKAVVDLVTGVRIKPDPFEFDVTDSVNVKRPDRLLYVTKETRSFEEVAQYLEELKNNRERLRAYMQYMRDQETLAKRRSKLAKISEKLELVKTK